MRVALTFDDGPSQWTVEILQLLAKHRVRATFFVCGHAIEEHAETLRMIAFDGHEIGNHTYDHARMTNLDDLHARWQLEHTQTMIEQTAEHASDLWRAPYFDTNERINKIGADLGLRHVGANLDPGDFRSSCDRIVEKVATAEDGDTVLLHDGVPPDGGSGHQTRQPTVKALAWILRLKNIDFVTAGELNGLART